MSENIAKVTITKPDGTEVEIEFVYPTIADPDTIGLLSDTVEMFVPYETFLAESGDIAHAISGYADVVEITYISE